MATYTDLNEEKMNDSQVGDGQSQHLNQYNQALQRLTQVKDELPTYDKSYDSTLQGLFQDLANYEKFQYDTRSDSLYQAYKQSYTDAGRMAMMDTMGQAAALTGGYGNSYGQSVGQQQYGAYLQQLNDVLPETYGMAYRQYQDGRTALQNQYNMTLQLSEDEYQKYQDKLDAYYKELSYWQNTADTAYGRYQQEEEQQYNRQQDDYRKQQDAYERLADMIVTMGYEADENDLAAAGMTERQYQAYLNYYYAQNQPAAGGGGSGRRSRSKDEEEETQGYEWLLESAKNQIDLGMSVEEVNGNLARNVIANGLSVEETRRIIEELTSYGVSKGKL